jgi:hypothetical protein
LRVYDAFVSGRYEVYRVVAFKEIPERELRAKSIPDWAMENMLLSCCIQRNPRKGIESQMNIYGTAVSKSTSCIQRNPRKGIESKYHVVGTMHTSSMGVALLHSKKSQKGN